MLIYLDTGTVGEFFEKFKDHGYLTKSTVGENQLEIRLVCEEDRIVSTTSFRAVASDFNLSSVTYPVSTNVTRVLEILLCSLESVKFRVRQQTCTLMMEYATFVKVRGVHQTPRSHLCEIQL